jgi:hypothetical protein
MLLAIETLWPTTMVQRCIFHVWLNVRTKLTLHPKTEAGRELLGLTRTLLRGIPTKELARRWQEQLIGWEAQYGSFIRERTYRAEPAAGRKWWYTHRKLRSAYKQLEKLLRDGQLFTYLDTPTTKVVPRTTNHVEGGINSQLRTRLKDHRGMSYEHQMKLVERYLYSRTEVAKSQPFSMQKPPRKIE